MQKYRCPFTVSDAGTNVTDLLELPFDWQINICFYISRLKAAFEDYEEVFPVRRAEQHPKLILVDGKEENEVEQILTRRTLRNSMVQYLMRRKSYDTTEDTWKDVANLQNVRTLVRQYENLWQSRAVDSRADSYRAISCRTGTHKASSRQPQSHGTRSQSTSDDRRSDIGQRSTQLELAA